MNDTKYYNPEYDFLVNELKLKKVGTSLIEMDYQQLQKFYNHYNLQDLNFGQLNNNLREILKVIYKYKNFHSSQSEKETWFLNIKHTYELLNKIPNIDSKNITIHFEKKIYNRRIDTAIENENGFFIIEYSYLKESENLKDKYEEKRKQLYLYCNNLYMKTKKYIIGAIYIENIDETKEKTLNNLKIFLE